MYEISWVVFVYFLLLAAETVLWAKDTEDWPPIPPEDLTLKDNPDVPGSSAMILLKKDFRDDRKKVRELYYRIKIFNEEGRTHADIEVPYVRGAEEVKDIAARTIQSDGRVVPFRGRIFEKTLIRQRKRGLMAKTFTLPEVGPGSIIEYRYQRKWKKDDWFASTWIVQEPREAQLMLRPKKMDYASVNVFARQFPDDFMSRFPSVNDDDVRRMILRNLPPFEPEVHMPPEQQVAMRYHVVYTSWDWSWGKIGQLLAEIAEDFIGNPKKLRGVVGQLVSPQDPPETKLRKLYFAVQDRIRNLSYEESYTKKERKREKMKDRKSAADVWKNGYGLAHEISYLFVALCRAAGFTADIVLVSQRDTHYFDREVVDPSQLDGQVVVVDVDGEPQYFDPGTRFAPFGWLSWENQKVWGMRLSDEYSSWVTTPLLDPEQNLRHRDITLELQPDGAALVKVVTRYTGQYAINRRNDFFELSREQHERQLRDELEQRFPAAQVKDISWNGLDDSGESAEISFTFELPDRALVLGSRLLLRPMIFAGRSPFPHWKRKHPVYFSTPYTAIEEVKVVPPEGFEVEYLPKKRHDEPFGEYEMEVSRDGNSVLCRKRVSIRDITPPENNYLFLKEHFDTIQAGDQLHLVFSRP